MRYSIEPRDRIYVKGYGYGLTGLLCMFIIMMLLILILLV